ncbi:MAG: hypothetical protein M1164_01205 [Candidatus Marsarchaeota archaeon]|jgi:hypothetical protein|nr:hypothetical protein [Candidatus Marsarchaeota archaeon]
MENRSLSIFAAILISFALLGISAAAPTGVTSIRLNNTHATFYLNTSEIFAYNVTLYNGTAGETYLGIGPSSALIANGIYTGLAPDAGIPPWNGTLFVKVLGNATVGNYTIPIGAVGADPSSHGIAVLYMSVLSYSKPSTTVTTTVKNTTTIPSNSVTTSVLPTTTILTTATTSIAAVTTPPVQISTTELYIIVSIVAIIVVVIVAVYLWNRRRW